MINTVKAANLAHARRFTRPGPRRPARGMMLRPADHFPIVHATDFKRLPRRCRTDDAAG